MSDLPPIPNTNYDSLPLNQNEHLSNQLYNVPQHSTENLQSGSNYGTPQVPYQDLSPGATPPPRFIGQALYDQPGGGIRDSYASSHQTFPSVGASSEYGSVYALNDTVGSRGSYRDDPSAVALGPMGGERFLEEKNQIYAPPRQKSKKTTLIAGVVAAVLLVLVAVGVTVYFTAIKPKHGSSSTGSGSSSSSASKPTSSPKNNAAVTGGDGSKVTMDDGSTFTYQNKFGGTWYYDAQDPFNNNAQVNSWTPPLNKPFRYGVDKIRGVNIGGWLVTEPFMQVSCWLNYLTFVTDVGSRTPALFEPYLKNPTPAVDEWTLSQAMAADSANGGMKQLENHYKTFITEQDFAQIAGAGLNYVRIPIAYWAIEVRSGEPFLPQVSWQYFLKAIRWARKYGLRINIDLHALPGSQNGWNHSGKLGTVGMLNGPMGLANAQRSLDYIRIIAEFISQPQYKDVVTMFGITNEPQGPVVGQDALSRYYLQAYNLVRVAGGTGEGNGPYVSIHDAFLDPAKWAGVLPNADRVNLDSHLYIAFGTQSAGDISTFGNTPCTAWGANMNTSMSNFGLSSAGEFALAVNDCGLYVNGVNLGTRYEGTYAGSGPRVGSCDLYTNYKQYDQAMKDGLKQFAVASMDALQNWFFWTWKIGNSTVTGDIGSPAWSYQLGLQNGWIPTDPRTAEGVCGGTSPWNGPLQPWQTGGAGAGQIPASVTNQLSWPPPVISSAGAATTLPVYTPTGPVPTLPVPTDLGGGKKIDAGSGWTNAGDQAGLAVEIPGCTYLDPWVDPGTAPPAVCAKAKSKRGLQRRVAMPGPTPPPKA